jgi:hypothetical protein
MKRGILATKKHEKARKGEKGSGGKKRDGLRPTAIFGKMDPGPGAAS